MAEEKDKKGTEGTETPEAPKKKKYSVVFRTENSQHNSLKVRSGATSSKTSAKPAGHVTAGAGKPMAAGARSEAKAAAAARAVEEVKAAKAAEAARKAAQQAEEETGAALQSETAGRETEERVKRARKKTDTGEAAAENKTAETEPAEMPKRTRKKADAGETAAEIKAAETEPAKKPARARKKTDAEENASEASAEDKKTAKSDAADKKSGREPEEAKPAPRFVDMNAVRAANQPIVRRTPAGQRTGSTGGYNPDNRNRGQRTGSTGGYNPDNKNKGPRGSFGSDRRGGRPAGTQGAGGSRQQQPGAFDMSAHKPGKGGKAARSQGNRFDKKNSDELRRPGSAKVSNKDLVRPGKPAAEPDEPQIKMITIPEVLTIKDLAAAMRIQPATIIKKLFLQGEIVTLNDEIDYEKAENIAVEFDVLCEKEIPVDVIAELTKDTIEDDEESLIERPPVVCVMGHVDHGKTSLLDAIRKTNVTSREAGGITQAIGAYMVEINGRKLTFLDTPGHEAFTAMRMRGAQATDIAILVVAADDGVMPQTVEAINHAKAAGVDIVVAINKIDKPAANVDRVKQELTEYELVAEDWGGSTTMVPVSAKSGAGINDLLEMVLLDADVKELKANPNRNARGLVIEAKLEKGRGPVATVLVQKGTLHVGDTIAAGSSYGKIRAMIDDKGRQVKSASPSTPVEVLGLSDVPGAGEIFVATKNEKEARAFAETFIAEEKKRLVKETRRKTSLDDIFEQIKEGELKELNLIVKADVQGSVEAVKDSLVKLSNDEVVVKVIHSAAGNINESDVTLASASNAIIIGFNVKVDNTAKASADTEKVDIRLYDIIYKAIEDVELAMKGMLAPVFEEHIIGHALVRQTFKASTVGMIAGSFVLDGKLVRGCKCRITRGEEQLYDGPLSSLKRFKDDAKEVREGYECGLVFEGFTDLAEDDRIEAYEIVEVARS